MAIGVGSDFWDVMVRELRNRKEYLVPLEMNLRTTPLQTTTYNSPYSTYVAGFKVADIRYLDMTFRIQRMDKPNWVLESLESLVFSRVAASVPPELLMATLVTAIRDSPGELIIVPESTVAACSAGKAPNIIMERDDETARYLITIEE